MTEQSEFKGKPEALEETAARTTKIESLIKDVREMNSMMQEMEKETRDTINNTAASNRNIVSKQPTLTGRLLPDWSFRSSFSEQSTVHGGIGQRITGSRLSSVARVFMETGAIKDELGRRYIYQARARRRALGGG